MFNKLRTVVYHANDLSAAKEWYTALTNVQPYFDEPFYVGFNINGFELGLDPDMTGIETGNHHTVYWDVNEIREAFNKAVQLGATVVQEITNVGGSIEVATVQDPFGNYIGFISGN